MYFNKIDYAKEALEKFEAIISKWPKINHVIEDNLEKRRSTLLEYIKNPQLIQNNVEEEISKHKLTKIQDNELIWSENPINLWDLDCVSKYIK